ncbi:MAG: FAD-binding oxidoreductase [Mycobacteriales bacterium]
MADQLERIKGPVFRPGEDGYDGERAGFQAGVPERPELVVGAAAAEDVVAAVAYAAGRGLPVAVRATGHGLEVPATGGVLVSTARMDGVRIDPEARTAWVEAGVRWKSVVAAAAPHGLAPLSGSAPHVGAVGYTLGGGLGLLSREFGYAADHVRRLEVVTADGQLRQVDADTDPDLFWALRGGRDNFGVVTGMEIGLLPVSGLYGGALTFDATGDVEVAARVLATWREWTATAPESVGSSVGLVPLPDLPVIPEPLRGRYVAQIRLASTGDPAGGEALAAPLRAIGPRLTDTLRALPYTEVGSIYQDPTNPMPFSGTNALLRELDPAVPDLILGLAGPDAPVRCVVDVRHLGGALARSPRVPSAVGHRDAAYVVNVVSPLAGPDAAGAVNGTHRRLMDALAPWTLGRFLNFLAGGSPVDLAEVYEPADRARLATLKAAYDPAGTFRLTRPVTPS